MPEALIIGGPNGAGKSTLAYEILKREPLPFLSADEIAANINPSDPAAARFQAGRVFLRRLEETIEGRRSFMTETTLSGLAFKATMQRLRATGYAINIAFVFLESPELCIARIRSRVARGGHFVSDDDVIRRFHRSIRNFWNSYRYFGDGWYLYINSGDRLRPVAAGMRDQFKVMDRHNFDKFREIITEGHGDG